MLMRAFSAENEFDIWHTLFSPSEDGTPCLLLFMPGWALLDARAYSF